MQLVNRAVHGYLVSVPGERNVGERRARDRAGIEVVADVADVRVDDASLHLKNERLRIVKRRIDVLFRPSHLPIQPANVDAEIRTLAQHEVVSINASRG